MHRLAFKVPEIINIARLLFLFLISFSEITFAGIPINVLQDKTATSFELKFEYFEDKEKKYNFEEIRSLPDEYWTRVKESSVSFGFSASQYWLRLHVANENDRIENKVLEIAYPLLDDVLFYSFKQGGEIRALHIGDSQSFLSRDIDHPSILYRFQLGLGEGIDLYARIQTEGSVILPLRLSNEKAFFEAAAQEQKFHFFYYGCLSVIVLINFAIFITLREKLYLFYSLASFGYLLFFFTARGHALQLVFPEFPALSSQLFLSSLPFLALFSLLFAREFLKTEQNNKKLDLALRGMIYFEYFNLVASIVLDYNAAVQLSAVSSIVFFALLFCAGPIAWRANQRAGVFFTIAWVPLTLGVIAQTGRTSGYLPNNFVTEYAMQIGSGIEAFILTLALADRLYREREEKILAQEASIQTDKQRLAVQNQLSEALMRDPITNLPNRNRFEMLVDNLFDERPQEQFAICVARVTRVNEITRTLGISSVERIFRLIADRVNFAVRRVPGVVSTVNSQGGADATFQLTGDTFGVLIRKRIFDTHLDQYTSFIQTLSLPIEMDSLSIELEPRIGCAFYPEHGANASALIRNALVAMESAHHTSEQIGYYDTTLDIYNKSRLTLMSDLRDALKNDEPYLYYQPKLDLRNGSVVGLEALIRWQHPDRGFVSPVDFVPLAEQTGVIKQLTLWAVERASKDLQSLRGIGYAGNMSINISAKDLLSENLAQQIQLILNKYSLDPTKIFLELTETAAMDEPEKGLVALNKLTSIGLKVSIDDFGAGYSSLSYLKQLPASEIKLDRSLVKDITSSDSSRLIVKTSIDMAHGLGYLVVAEGVENAETCSVLKELKCDKLQGFWFCKPMSLEGISDWLQTSR